MVLILNSVFAVCVRDVLNLKIFFFYISYVFVPYFPFKIQLSAGSEKDVVLTLARNLSTCENIFKI